MSEKKQAFHLEAPRGLLNDPNGLSWFQGKYYIFFQWNPLKKDHSHKEWGLFTSRDLLNWRLEGSKILPDQGYDRDGAYSGSGYVIDDQLCLFYTGNKKAEGQRKSSQCLAVTKDGVHYQKEGVIFPTPEDYTGHFRDPKVLRGRTGGYFMVIGAQRRSRKGEIALCRSLDGKSWKYQGTLAASRQYEMVECPDLFELDGTDVLLFNLQKRDTEKDCPVFSFSAYKLGAFDEETGRFADGDLDAGFEKLDAGFDFYAPQTFLTPDGRRLLLAWMSRMDDEEEQVFGQQEPNIHCLTMPRELFLRENQLCQRPARELYRLLGETIAYSQEPGCLRAVLKRRTFFFRMGRADGHKDLEIQFFQGEAKLVYISGEKKLTFCRKNWVRKETEERSAAVFSLEEIEVWSDQSSMEIFINGGEQVYSSRIFPQDGQPRLTVRGDMKNADVCIREIIKNK